MAINKYNKYNVWRRYKSYDSGKTWVAMDDYEAFMTEENVEACGYIPVTYRWVAVDGTICNTETHTLYSRTRQQASYDRGQTWDWTEPAVYNYGDVIEENSPHCGYPIYQWVTVEGATMCGTDEATKYNQYEVEKEQVSTDNGISWTDTGKQREGKMIENLSLKCGYVPEWKWEFTSISCTYKIPSDAQSALTRVLESTEYCEKGNKYNRSKIELSTDNGATWAKVHGDYQITLLESASTECGYAEQWVTIDGEYVCGDADSLYSKYNKEKKQISYDSGATWTDTDETRTSETFEELSTDCGYNKSTTVAVYTNGTVKYFDIEGALDKSKLTSSDTIKRLIVGSKVNGFDEDTTSIYNGAFQNCSTLETVEMPDSVAYIGNYAFCKCSGLTKVVLDSALTTIGNSAFRSCSSLTGITIPNSVTSIGNDAFIFCSSLRNITLPDGITTINGFVFEGCSSLTSITIPDTVSEIGDHALAWCSSLTGITIPNSVRTIDDGVFYNCSRLTGVTIPVNVTSISNSLFANCTSLRGITISNSITSIGESAFYNCSSLTGVTIPNSVISIGNSAFNRCSNLASLTVNSVTPPSLGEYAIPYKSNATKYTRIYVPVNSVDTYKYADGWRKYASQIEAIPS